MSGTFWGNLVKNVRRQISPSCKKLITTRPHVPLASLILHTPTWKEPPDVAKHTGGETQAKACREKAVRRFWRNRWNYLIILDDVIPSMILASDVTRLHVIPIANCWFLLMAHVRRRLAPGVKVSQISTCALLENLPLRWWRPVHHREKARFKCPKQNELGCTLASPDRKHGAPGRLQQRSGFHPTTISMTLSVEIFPLENSSSDESWRRQHKTLVYRKCGTMFKEELPTKAA